MVGFRTMDFPCIGDNDPTLRPRCVAADTPEALTDADPVLILDEPNSLTPYLHNLRNGTILALFNRYATHPAGSRDALLKQGRLPINEHDGHVFTREPITVMASADGVRWHKHGEVDTPEFAHSPAFRGRIVEGRDGALLLAVFTARESIEGTGHNVSMSVLVRSEDDGRSWHYVSTIADHPSSEIGFNETSLYRTPSGTLVALLRASGDANLYTARSEDDGASWSTFQRHDVFGFPQDALLLQSGNALLTYGVRKAPHGIRGRLVDAELHDIDAAPEFVIRDDSLTGRCGYPMAVQLDDGRIVVVYYVTRDERNRPHVAASILRETD